MTGMGSSGRQVFGRNVRRFREAIGLTQEVLAETSELDRSYIGGVERGERNPALNAILRLASALRVAPAALFDDIGENVPQTHAPDMMQAIPTPGSLLIRFRYDQYDAEYQLSGATRSQYDEVIGVLKTGLASRASRSDIVTKAFLQAVKVWPEANASDLWAFVINRAYCDRSNHPDANARLNLEQSWKRTSGWALERVLIAHYGPFLMANGISANTASKSQKSTLLGGIDDSRIIPDKADVLLTFCHKGESRLLGVVHVKASMAERRTDDVPMSQALLRAGYLSIFWTMDSKSFPGTQPVNLGEFGDAAESEASDKRRDFEVNGYFSACFSYNRNTMPTEGETVAARIYVCDFTNPDDQFSQFLLDSLGQRQSC